MTNIDLGLAGKVVLVTGGVRGVGAGISTVFREAGAVVVTCARRRADEGSDVADLEFYSVDLRDAEAVRAMIDGIVADHGRLDVVVNNAGGAPFALAAEASANFHAKIVALNLLSALTVAQEANRTLTVLACVAGGCGVALLPSWIRSMDFRGVRFCEVRDGRSLPSLDLSAIWPARSTPTLADLFAHLDLGKD